MIEWLALVILGCATATFGVMVGTGGGVIFVPMLLLLFDFDPEIAAGTSLTLVALNSFAGTYTYTRLGFVRPEKRHSLCRSWRFPDPS